MHTETPLHICPSMCPTSSWEGVPPPSLHTEPSVRPTPPLWCTLSPRRSESHICDRRSRKRCGSQTRSLPTITMSNLNNGTAGRGVSTLSQGSFTQGENQLLPKNRLQHQEIPR